MSQHVPPTEDDNTGHFGSLYNLAASGANDSSTVSLSFTPLDILALSGDMAMITGSFIPRMQCFSS